MEKPQRGSDAVPFMNNTTLFSFTICVWQAQQRLCEQRGGKLCCRPWIPHRVNHFLGVRCTRRSCRLALWLEVIVRVSGAEAARKPSGAQRRRDDRGHRGEPSCQAPAPHRRSCAGGQHADGASLIKSTVKKRVSEVPPMSTQATRSNTVKPCTSIVELVGSVAAPETPRSTRGTARVQLGRKTVVQFKQASGGPPSAHT